MRSTAPPVAAETITNTTDSQPYPVLREASSIRDFPANVVSGGRAARSSAPATSSTPTTGTSRPRPCRSNSSIVARSRSAVTP